MERNTDICEEETQKVSNTSARHELLYFNIFNHSTKFLLTIAEEQVANNILKVT